MYISTDTVHRALRNLKAADIGRVGRVSLLGYLLLKAKLPSPEGEYVLASTGEASVREQLDRFTRFEASDGTFSYLNPFSTAEGYLEFLRPGYERRGTFTQLETGRNLEWLGAERQGTKYRIKIAEAASITLAEKLGLKMPAKATAAFFMRGTDFPNGTSPDAVVAAFRDTFRLRQADFSNLFLNDANFSIEFAPSPFSNKIQELPDDLRPKPSNARAEQTASSDVAIGKGSFGAAEDFELIVPATTRRRVEQALAMFRAVALVGPPGTGKSRILETIFEDAQVDPTVIGMTKPPEFVRYAAEVDWTARNLIGGYFPQKSGTLEFQDGFLLRAIANNQILWLDEMNRADLDRILGPLLTFLAGQSVDLGMSRLSGQSSDEDSKSILLRWSQRPDCSVDRSNSRQIIYEAGTNWRIVGTYNNVDRGRVFPMGSALVRRWALVPVSPANPAEFRSLLESPALQDLPVAAGAKLASAYSAHMRYIDIGPAPFLDMAKYVMLSLRGKPTPSSEELGAALGDAYILFMGQQLVRIDPERRPELFKELESIFDAETIAEASKF